MNRKHASQQNFRVRRAALSAGDLENRIEKETIEVQKAMATLGRRLERGDDSELIHWVIPSELGCAHRPLRHHPQYGGSGANISVSATAVVFDWADQMKKVGVKSFISLMHDRDVRCYQSLELHADDLMDFYRKSGFHVAHLPWEDPRHKKATEADKRKNLLAIRSEANKAYGPLPKPIVIQCSAGIDRSALVAAYIHVIRHAAGGKSCACGCDI